MKSSRAAWLVVGLLWVVAMLNYLDRQVIFSLFPPIRADLKATDFQLGLLGAAFLWVYGLLSPFSGYLADKYDRVKVILVSLFVWSAVTWLTGHARGFNELLFARGLMGISEAAYLPAALALIADYHKPATRSLATGIHQSGLYAGIALGGVFGGWMGEHYGWRAAFASLGLVGVAYAVVLLFFLKAPASAERGEAPQTGRGRSAEAGRASLVNAGELRPARDRRGAAPGGRAGRTVAGPRGVHRRGRHARAAAGARERRRTRAQRRARRR